MTDIDRIARHCASLLIENENFKIRIEKLEAALREIAYTEPEDKYWPGRIARKALGETP